MTHHFLVVHPFGTPGANYQEEQQALPLTTKSRISPNLKDWKRSKRVLRGLFPGPLLY